MRISLLLLCVLPLGVFLAAGASTLPTAVLRRGSTSLSGSGSQSRSGSGSSSRSGSGSSSRSGSGSQSRFGRGSQSRFGRGSQSRFGRGSQSRSGRGSPSRPGRSASGAGVAAAGAAAAAGIAAGRLKKKPKKPKLDLETEAQPEEEPSAFDCFPARSVVSMRGAPVRLDALRVGDVVQTGAHTHAAVFTFSHARRDGVFEFVQIATARGALVASSGHFVHVARGTVPAADVVVGDALRAADGGLVAVTSVGRVWEKGLYNPQTVDGDIVVDGFVVSTYTKAVPINAAVSLLAPMRAAYAVLGVDVSGGLLRGEGMVRKALVGVAKFLRRVPTISVNA